MLLMARRIEGPNGISKAARGDMVPDWEESTHCFVGSRWIVSTSKGLISTQ
jgi:hypothetical protein